MREFIRRQTPAPRSDRARVPPVQHTAGPQAATRPASTGLGHDFGRIAVDAAAALGTSGPAEWLPHLDAIQRSFGPYDVTPTRAHVDSAAAEGSRAMGARAFTAGNDVAFAGRPTLSVAAHEATHVLQQRAGVPLRGGVGVSGDAYERHADAVAEQVVRGRSSVGLLSTFLSGFANGRSLAPGRVVQRDDAGTPRGTPTGTTPPVVTPAATTTPLKYSRVRFTLATPDPKWTEKALLARVTATFTSVGLTGVTAAMPKETNLFLYYALLGLASRDNWGHEIDVVAPIAWPAKIGDPPPRARVTVRIDDRGNATAELVASGPTPLPAQTTVAAASAQLRKDYKLASVRDDGTATWSDAEISDVVAALAMLPAADKAALKGVELIRVKDLEGGFAGEFSRGGGVTGAALTTLKSLPWLKLADGAFADRAGVQFYGGTAGTVPASFETILHEVGHAVERETLRAAAEAADKALIDLNKKVVPVNQSAKDYKKLADDYAKIYADYDRAKKAGDKALADTYATQLRSISDEQDELAKKNKTAVQQHKTAETVYETKKAAEEKTRVAAAVVTPLKADAAAKKTAAAQALAAATAAIGALAAADVGTSKAYLAAVEATAKAIEAFTKGAAAKGDIEDLEKPALAQVEVRDQARSALAKAAPTHPALAPLNLAATAQDAWLEAERTAARAPQRTRRVQKFVDLVTANAIAPFTEYARKNWPFRPQEFYAESYALWLADPAFLSANYKIVYDFFQTGEYRK